MHKKAAMWLLWSTLLTITACSGENPPSLSDTTAAAIVQERWNMAAAVLINLGPVQFHPGNTSSETQPPISEYPIYQAIARMRLIELDNEPDDSKESLQHSDRVAGVARILNVSLTHEGEKLATIQNVKNSNSRSASFRCGEYRVEKIISNNPLQISGEKSAKYRAVLGTHVYESKPEFREACVRRGEPETREHRFRALLRHDPIANSWSVEVSDAAPRKAEFESENVPLMLAKLRADRRAQAQSSPSLK